MSKQYRFEGGKGGKGKGKVFVLSNSVINENSTSDEVSAFARHVPAQNKAVMLHFADT